MDKDTMILLIKLEYENEELKKYKPKRFADYLLEKFAELRLEKTKN